MHMLTFRHFCLGVGLIGMGSSYASQGGSPWLFSRQPSVTTPQIGQSFGNQQNRCLHRWGTASSQISVPDQITTFGIQSPLLQRPRVDIARYNPNIITAEVDDIYQMQETSSEAIKEAMPLYERMIEILEGLKRGEDFRKQGQEILDANFSISEKGTALRILIQQASYGQEGPLYDCEGYCTDSMHDNPNIGIEGILDYVIDRINTHISLYNHPGSHTPLTLFP